MRNLGIILSAVALAVLLASFAPISWSTTPHLPTVLASISPTDLTIGYGKLPMAENDGRALLWMNWFGLRL